MLYALCSMPYALCLQQFSGRLLFYWFIMPCSEAFKFQGTDSVNPTIPSLLVSTFTLAFVYRCQRDTELSR
jgi:hypothetical protein